MKTGQLVRDNLTGQRGRVIRTNKAGVTIDRREGLASLGQRFYTWREAYAEFSAGHRRIEVLSEL